MRDPKKRIASQAKVWLRKCRDVGILKDVLADIRFEDIRKENGKGKEKFPPHPLIEKSEREEKAPPPPPARACVRAVNGNPVFEAVERYAAINGIAPDFAKRLFDKLNRENEFHRWRHPKTGKPMRNWQAYFSICWKRRDDFDPLPAAEEAPPKIRVFLPLDWQLCAERCAHFDATRNCCTCGIAVPPAHRDTPEPPEECPHFKSGKPATNN